MPDSSPAVVAPLNANSFDAKSLRPQRSELADAEMDITPMIDCVFLLLIFFIVCSTMDTQAAVDLAPARHGKGVSERESIVITIAEGGLDAAPVYLADGVGGTPLPTDRKESARMITDYVTSQMRKSSKNDVLIKADRNVAHRDVADVIKAVSQAPGVKLHLAVMEAD